MKWLNWETLWEALFSSKWRINGWMYVFYTMASYIAYFILLTICLIIFWTENTILISIIVGIPFIIIIILNWIKRFHDMWKNWWNMFLLLIPIYNIIVGLNLSFKRWDKEKNNYWIKPKELSKTMKIITVILFILYIGISFLWM